ncbi:MAG: Fe-S cluster assembly sulfur transfer protein SufU [Patescibacteria group bacterium]
MNTQFYRDYILDHYKHPRHYGKLDDAVVVEGTNPSCGDELRFYVKRTGDHLDRIQFEGRGCAISQASSSILLEQLEGKTIADLSAWTESQVLEAFGGQISEGRLKCALLALRSLQQGLR